MHRTTVSNPNPITKTTTMKITKTLCPRHPVSNLQIRRPHPGKVNLKLFKTYNTLNPYKRATLWQSVHCEHVRTGGRILGLTYRGDGSLRQMTDSCHDPRGKLQHEWLASPHPRKHGDQSDKPDTQ